MPRADQLERMEYQREYRHRMQETRRCVTCGEPSQSRNYCPTHLQRANERARDLTARMRDETIEAYGGKCRCCGETEPLFLTIDHINNNGREHRRELATQRGGYGSRTLYTLLKRLNYPSDYRLLCINCNLGRHRNGGVCPHEKARHASN